MTRTATINYHIHKPERQAFELDAGGIIGNLIAPELAATVVTVLDERAVGAAPTFETASVGFAEFPTSVPSFGPDAAWRPTYDGELTKLLATEIDAKEVIIFDHTVRIDDQGRPSIARSALDMVEDPSIQSIRKSIESRTLVRY